MERLLFPREVSLIVSRSIDLHVIFILVLIGIFINKITFLKEKFSVLFRDKGFLSTEKKDKVSFKLGLFPQI